MMYMLGDDLRTERFKKEVKKRTTIRRPTAEMVQYSNRGIRIEEENGCEVKESGYRESRRRSDKTQN